MSTSQTTPALQAPLSPGPQSLSQSTSNLLSEGQVVKPELRKSASSTVCQSQPEAASTSPGVLAEVEHQTETTEQPQTSSPTPSPTSHWSSSNVSNVSGSGNLCHRRNHSAITVQRSHSNLTRIIQTRGPGGTRRASLSSLALGSSPVHRAQLQLGQGSQAPDDIERDLGAKDGTSHSAWTLGESQVCVPPLDQKDTDTHSSSPQAGSKAPRQQASTSSQAIHSATCVCSMKEAGASSCCHMLPIPGALAFPKLVASVSESGLQTQHGAKFQYLLPGGLPGHTHCCAHSWGPTGCVMESGTRTKDMCTMTSASDLVPTLAPLPTAQDAGVQVAPMAICKAVATSPPPEASLALNTFQEVILGSDHLGSNLEETPSPVRDVRWDAEGMTWEVYGAAVDPEVLGVAIQKHLEMQFEQLQRESASEDRLSVEGRRGPLRAVMQSLRRPSCCGCSGAAPE